MASCGVGVDGYATIGCDSADRAFVYESMSITKGAVGLVYLERFPGRMLDTPVFPELRADISLTYREALCHQTGVENDDSFSQGGYDEFMKAVTQDEGAYGPARKKFIELHGQKFVKKSFQYNNVIWRVLVQHFYDVTGQKVSDVLQEWIPELDFARDKPGFMHGLNGMKMTCALAKQYGLVAQSILLRQGVEPLLHYAPVPLDFPNDWGRQAGEDVLLYPFFGWFVVAQKSPFRLLGAFAVGFMSQYVCVDLRPGVTHRPPGVQLRRVFAEAGEDPEIHRFAERFFAELASSI